VPLLFRQPGNDLAYQEQEPRRSPPAWNR
jgi:hypothetical protein